MNLTKFHNRFIELSKPLNRIDTGTMPKLQRIDEIKVIAYDFYGTLFISGVGDIGVDDGNPDKEILLDALSASNVKIENQNAGKEGFNIYNEVVNKTIINLKRKGIEYPEPDIRAVWKDVIEQMEKRDLVSFQPYEDLYGSIAIEFEARMNPVWPMPNVTETLHHFKKRGYTQSIISNSQFYTPIVLEALTDQSLEELGFSDELLHWSYEEEMKKPDLRFYKNYLKKLADYDPELMPHHVLFIGNDMLKDIYPAKTVGMKTALFAGDERSLKWRKEDSRCNKILPDLIITDFSQLTDCV